MRLSEMNPENTKDAQHTRDKSRMMRPGYLQDKEKAKPAPGTPG
jgi:hypothetical protein